jgi:Domain of unknown function (DUF4383)
MSTYNTTAENTDAARQLRLATTVVGATFLLVGILGFVPGITTNYDQMEFAGHESGAELLGIFQVSILHNIVHVLFGVAGLAMARQARTASLYLIGGGAIYLVLFLYGLFVADDHKSSNFVPLNSADNWLHLVLGLGMIGIGFALSRKWREESNRTTGTTGTTV